jgi:hypothetical protein
MITLRDHSQIDHRVGHASLAQEPRCLHRDRRLPGTDGASEQQDGDRRDRVSCRGVHGLQHPRWLAIGDVVIAVSQVRRQCWHSKIGVSGGTHAHHPLGLGAFAPQEGEVEAFDLTFPSFFLGAAAAGDEVFFEFAEPGQHRGVDAEHGAADAPLTELTTMF